jgi:TolB protein
VLAVPNAPGQRELDIWTADSEGHNREQLTSSPATEFSPMWSPDGTKIVYRVESETKPPDIWVMNADGSGKRNLAKTPKFTEWGGSWTPDGADRLLL